MNPVKRLLNRPRVDEFRSIREHPANAQEVIVPLLQPNSNYGSAA